MSNIDLIKYKIKNSKLTSSKLEKLSLCFTQDLTASQTAKKLDISRQTVNSYYKKIRFHLISNEKKIDCKNSCLLKYINFNNEIMFFLEDEEKIVSVEESCTKIDKQIKEKLLKHKKANSAKLLYNKREERFIVIGFLKTQNCFEDFINTRLKKFRGINKNNFKLHIKESIIRYNEDKNSLFKHLITLFN